MENRSFLEYLAWLSSNMELFEGREAIRVKAAPDHPGRILQKHIFRGARICLNLR